MRFGRTFPHLMVAGLVVGIPVTPFVKDPGVRSPARVVYGAPTNLGSGQVRTYVEYEGDKAVEVGVEVSEAVMQGLPAEGHNPATGLHSAEYVLDLPAGNPTPFQHVVVQWNPGGHEPPGMYDLPHFDFHFYTIDNAARLAISPKDPAFEQKSVNQPGAEFIPAGYILPAPVAIPTMGVHWLEAKTPELNGGTFTQTLIYGSWDGRMIFVEPMITQAFLMKKETLVKELPAAAKYSPAGLHPTHYAIRWIADQKVWRVSLGGLTERN
jgi:hypothetical protein